MSGTHPKIGRNPFAQPEQIWQVDFSVTADIVPQVEQAFDGMSLAVSSFEEDERLKTWNVRILLESVPDEKDLRQRLRHMGLNGATPEPRIALLMPDAWQVALERDFPPITLGRFFVHGAHAAQLRPVHALGLQVEAGMAFGSGEHQTTSGCLRAIDRLSRRRSFSRVLDMGCGSGILGIAAAKRWRRAGVLASDVDPVAAEVAKRNIRINRVCGRTRAMAADGYKSAIVNKSAPYDLILCNILARPLVKMAPSLAAHLAPGGVAVLSGLLTSQEPQVIAAHRAQGLKLVKRITQDGWSTLVMSK